MVRWIINITFLQFRPYYWDETLYNSVIIHLIGNVVEEQSDECPQVHIPPEWTFCFSLSDLDIFLQQIRVSFQIASETFVNNIDSCHFVSIIISKTLMYTG